MLIPGAGGAAWYWHRVVPELAARGHTAVAVDLPAADPAAGWAEYADAVVRAAPREPGLVVVAQSMGAFTAPLVVDRLDVARIVLVNPMVPAPGETAGEWWTNTGHDQSGAASADELRSAFFHDVPADVVEEAFAAEPPEQSGTPFGQPWPLDGWPDVPTRAIVGVDDRFFPLAFQRRVVRERLGLVPDEMPGGHLLALGRPVELVDWLVS